MSQWLKTTQETQPNSAGTIKLPRRSILQHLNWSSAAYTSLNSKNELSPEDRFRISGISALLKNLWVMRRIELNIQRVCSEVLVLPGNSKALCSSGFISVNNNQEAALACDLLTQIVLAWMFDIKLSDHLELVDQEQEINSKKKRKKTFCLVFDIIQITKLAQNINHQPVPTPSPSLICSLWRSYNKTQSKNQHNTGVRR